MMKIKEKNSQNFIFHFLTISFGTVINIVLGLLITPIITRLVSTEDYGRFSIFNMYTNIATMVLCMGLDQALVRFFYAREEKEYKQGLFRFCLIFPMSVTLVVSLFFIITDRSGFCRIEFSGAVLLMLCINIMAAICGRIVALILRATYQSKLYVVCQITGKVVYTGVILLILGLFRIRNFQSLVFSVVCSTISVAVIAMYYSFDYWTFQPCGTLIKRREILQYSFPFILSMGVTTIFEAADKLSLQYLSTYKELGIYSSAMSIIHIFAIVQSAFNILWAPMQTEHYIKNPNDTSFIQRGNSYITILMFWVGFNLVLFKDIFVLILGKEYRGASYILPFLIFHPIMYTISETTCSGIEKSKKSYLNIFVALGACIVNILGNCIFVPMYGGRGAAISTGVSYIVFFMIRTIFSNRYYYIDYHLKKLCILIITTVMFSWFCTFYNFNFITIGLYMINSMLLVVLYKAEIRELISIGKEYMKKL